MITDTVRDQISASQALLALLTVHPGLPLANPELQPFYDGDVVRWGLKINLHNHVSAFEPWRQALAIETADVDNKQDPDSLLAWLTADGS